MEPFDTDNTLRAHRQLQMGLWMPDMIRSVSHRQQERATAQDQIGELRSRKAQTLSAAQRLFVRLKDSMDAQTFHHVLQGVVDIHSGKKSTSAVVEELRPLVATRQPQLFEDFLDYIDPSNDLQRPQVTNEQKAASGSSPGQLQGVTNVTTMESKSSLHQLENETQSDEPHGSTGSLPSIMNSDSIAQPYQAFSPLRRVANFSQVPIDSEIPGSGRVNTYESSPGMAGFPTPPEFYSPIPPTFAQRFLDYTNQEVPLLRFAVETPMVSYGSPMPAIVPNVMDVRRLPPLGRFGPGTNPHSPSPQSQMSPLNAFPSMPLFQQQFLPPKTRPHSSLSRTEHIIDSRPQSMSPYIQGNVNYLPQAGLDSYEDHSFPSYGYDVQFSPPSIYPAQPKLAMDDDSFSTLEQEANYAEPHMPNMSASCQTPLQRKRGISDLRSSAEHAQPRKVSKTEARSRDSRPRMRNTPSRHGTPPDDVTEKPYVHHICGRRFTTLEAVKGHHHSEADGLGCWIRYGGNEKDKAWNLHPSCKSEVDVTQQATVEPSREQSPLPASQPRVRRTARKASKTTSEKGKGKEKFKEEPSSTSQHHVDNSSDEYLPELGMTQKQLNAIQGARPKRAARKTSGAKRGAKKN